MRACEHPPSLFFLWNESKNYGGPEKSNADSLNKKSEGTKTGFETMNEEFAITKHLQRRLRRSSLCLLSRDGIDRHRS